MNKVDRDTFFDAFYQGGKRMAYEREKRILEAVFGVSPPDLPVEEPHESPTAEKHGGRIEVPQ